MQQRRRRRQKAAGIDSHNNCNGDLNADLNADLATTHRHPDRGAFGHLDGNTCPDNHTNFDTESHGRPNRDATPNCYRDGRADFHRNAE